ncbi:MAG: hypothetical protein Q8K45_21415 [Rubrivivax sp.]|nr:hypothetical protein [Rubrivivax sp.]
MMHRRTGQRGVSLIEAVVALGVMAFGMLALVGVQATLRGSGDLSRQRSEAVRIAQETMENYRGYAALAGTSGEIDFAEIVTITRTAVDPADTALEGRLSTTFSSTITAPVLTNSAAMKPVAVTIDWQDRNGQFQSVELRSLVAGVPPELAGSLVLPPSREAFAGPGARHRNVPISAMTLPGVGLSVFKPPRRVSGEVAWIFNNLTGLVTRLCDVDAASTNESLAASLTTSDLAACTSVTAQLLSGYVRFANGNPTAAEAESPTGGTLNLNVALHLTSTGHPSPQTTCFDDATNNNVTAGDRREVVYNCLIYSNTARTWSGRLVIEPRDFLNGFEWDIANSAGTSNYKVCRYTPLSTDVDPEDRNVNHPLTYTTTGSAAGAGLTNQNYLVIAAEYTCPTETSTDGDLFNANTLLHQNGTATYFNTPPSP